MKISLNWLKAYIKTNLNAEQISRTLTQIGLEVEGFEKAESIRGGLAGLVVGEVLTCDKHPDADKLHVTTVDLGDGQPDPDRMRRAERSGRTESGRSDDQRHAVSDRRRERLQDQKK